MSTVDEQRHGEDEAQALSVEHAFPPGCRQNGEGLPALQEQMLGKVRKLMTPAEILAASRGEQPELELLEEITCTSCEVQTCPHHEKYKTPDFAPLFEGSAAERAEAGKRLLSEIVPAALHTQLMRQSIAASVHQMSSRKNPTLVFAFRYRDITRGVTCHVGRRLVFVGGNSFPLESVAQVETLVREAIEEVRRFVEH